MAVITLNNNNKVILWAVIYNKDRVIVSTDRVSNYNSLPKGISLPKEISPKVSVVVVVVVEEEGIYVPEVDCLSYVPKIFVVEVLYFLLLVRVLKEDNNSNNNPNYNNNPKYNNVVVYLIISVLV